ncbi:hypothetical protein G6F24_014438 [Rhizopus arrhizus]|nr:hypothetical protein G6F24_014438 [Rhizopus arrhizus]
MTLGGNAVCSATCPTGITSCPRTTQRHAPPPVASSHAHPVRRSQRTAGRHRRLPWPGAVRVRLRGRPVRTGAAGTGRGRVPHPAVRRRTRRTTHARQHPGAAALRSGQRR